MKHYNADNDKRLHEQFSFTLNGKKYEVVALNDDLLEQIDHIKDDFEEHQLSEIQMSQLSLFTGEDQQEFKDTPIRVMSGIINEIQNWMINPKGKSRAKK